MATNKPKVCGYIPQVIHTRFKEFCTENSYSDSQALVFILESFFNGSTPSKPLGDTPVEHQGITGRLDKLEEKLTLLMDMYTPIYSKLFPSSTPSDTPVEHQGIIADLLGSDAPSSLPVEHQEPQEHEDSKPPSDTPDGTLQEPQGEEDDKLPSDTPSDTSQETQELRTVEHPEAVEVIKQLRAKEPQTSWEKIAKALTDKGFIMIGKSGEPVKISHRNISPFAKTKGIE
jgi:hypothetical protein